MTRTTVAAVILATLALGGCATGAPQTPTSAAAEPRGFWGRLLDEFVKLPPQDPLSADLVRHGGIWLQRR